MTTPVQTSDAYETVPLTMAEAVHDTLGFLLGPTRLERYTRTDGTTSYTPYTRSSKGIPSMMIHLAVEDRAEAIEAQVRITSQVDADFRRAALRWARQELRVETGELDLDGGERAAIRRLVIENLPDLAEGTSTIEAVRQGMQALSGERAKLEAMTPFAHLDNTPKEAERFICDVAHAFGWDSDGRYTDLPLLLELVTAARDTLQGLRGALKVGPNSFTPAQLVEEVRLMRAHADDRDARARALADAYSTVGAERDEARDRLAIAIAERDKALEGIHLANTATKQADQERDHALARLREFASAQAAHDNATEFHDRRTRAIHAGLCIVAFHQSQSEPARLVMSWLAGQVAPPDEYVSDTVERALHQLSLKDEASEHRARSAISELHTEASLLIRARQSAKAAK